MRHDGDEHEGASMFGMLVTACACFAFTIGGAYMLYLSVEDFRTDHVREYDAAVLEWKDKYYYEAANVSVAVNVTSSLDPFSSSFVSAAATEENEGLRDPVTQDLLSYTPHRFVHTGALFPNANWTDDGQYSWKVDLQIVENGGDTVMLSTDFLTFHSTRYASEQMKMCYHRQKGSWINSRCEVYERISNLCLKVSRGDDGVWGFDSSEGDTIGCYYENSHDEFSQYGTTRVPGTNVHFGGGERPSGEIDMSDLNVVVRHYKDPYLVALRVTGGKLEFGATSSAMFWAGSVTLCVGMVLAIPFAIFGAMEIYKRKKEKEYDTLIEEEWLRQGDGQIVHEMEDSIDFPMQRVRPIPPSQRPRPGMYHDHESGSEPGDMPSHAHPQYQTPSGGGERGRGVRRGFQGDDNYV